MAPDKVSRRLSFLVTSLRGTPTGEEPTLVDAVRTRLGGLPKKATAADQQKWLAWGLALIVEYTSKAFTANDLSLLTDVQYGERVYEFFKVAVVRTKLLQKYAVILDDELEWQAQLRTLACLRDGTQVAKNPLYTPRSRFDPSGAGTLHVPWWAKTVAVTAILCLSALARALMTFYGVESGRARLQTLGTAFILWVTFFVWAKSGCDITWFARPLYAVGDDDDGATDDGSTSEQSSAPVSPEKDSRESSALRETLDGQRALAERLARVEATPPPLPRPPLKVEDDDLTTGGIGAEVTALADFVNGTTPQGSVSQTAHRMRGGLPPTVGADDLLQQLRDSGRGVGFLDAPKQHGPTSLRPEAQEWHPLRDSTSAVTQAQKILASWRMVKARQRSVPGWQPLWQVVAAIAEGEGLNLELERLLRASGYFGGSTATAPSSCLQSQLEQLVLAGPAMGGSGLSRPPPAPGELQDADSRWQSRLRPDLRRAAPEIYLNFRAEGVNNTREWVSREIESMEHTDSFTEFWHLATEADFRLDRMHGEEAKLSLLAGDDTLEIQFRRLASKVHELRTGDRDAAMHMLAISLPGKKRDLAPNWMVSEAQIHSRHSHQQAERVGKSFSRGGGGGNASRGGAATGKGSHGGDSKGGGEGKGGDRGRGGSGRRGGRGGR